MCVLNYVEPNQSVSKRWLEFEILMHRDFRQFKRNVVTICFLNVWYAQISHPQDKPRGAGACFQKQSENGQMYAPRTVPECRPWTRSLDRRWETAKLAYIDYDKIAWGYFVKIIYIHSCNHKDWLVDKEDPTLRELWRGTTQMDLRPAQQLCGKFAEQRSHHPVHADAGSIRQCNQPWRWAGNQANQDVDGCDRR